MLHSIEEPVSIQERNRKGAHHAVAFILLAVENIANRRGSIFRGHGGSPLVLSLNNSGFRSIKHLGVIISSPLKELPHGDLAEFSFVIILKLVVGNLIHEKDLKEYTTLICGEKSN